MQKNKRKKSVFFSPNEHFFLKSAHNSAIFFVEKNPNFGEKDRFFSKNSRDFLQCTSITCDRSLVFQFHKISLKINIFNQSNIKSSRYFFCNPC